MAKRTHSTLRESKKEKVGMNSRMEVLMKEFLNHIATASYEIALKLGFRGSFVTFLTDLQETLEEVLKKDKASSSSHSHHHGRAAIH